VKVDQSTQLLLPLEGMEETRLQVDLTPEELAALENHRLTGRWDYTKKQSHTGRSNNKPKVLFGNS